ncbi:MAG: hypothetical protein CMM87_05670 [Rickettsiales bacterium]|nr:hypothetical protein [Rickettsiales bacterium]|tara:strand:- start:64 stop:354 length:291 start_codon:yes stop_codon:yes gene_type:complete
MPVPSEYISDYRSHLTWIIGKLVKQDVYDYVYSTGAHGTCPKHLEDDLYDAIIDDVEENLFVEFKPEVDNENTDRFHEVTALDGSTTVWPEVWGST